MKDDLLQKASGDRRVTKSVAASIDNRVWARTLFTKNGKRVLAGDGASRFLAPLIATDLYSRDSMVSKGR